MKPIVLAATIVTAFAGVAVPSLLISRPSTAFADFKAEDRPTGMPPSGPTLSGPSVSGPSVSGPSIVDSGRPPVPIVRKLEPASPSAADAAPLPAASGQSIGGDAPAVAMTEPPPVPVDQPMANPGPDPAWGFPPLAASVPTFIPRGKEVRYFIVPLGGERVLIVSQDRGFGRGEKGRREKHHRHGWD